MSIRHLLVGLVAGTALGVGLSRHHDLSGEARATGAAPMAQAPASPASRSGADKATSGTRPVAAAVDRPPNPATPNVQRAPAVPAFLQLSEQVLVAGLSAEHAELLAPPPEAREPQTMPEMHAQFASEGRDNTWSYEMESALRQLVSETTDPRDIDLVRAECRATVCEVLAFGNLPDSIERWGQLNEQLNGQPWRDEFGGMALGSSDANGRTVLAMILQRKRP